MTIRKTDKTSFTEKEILDFISDYERTEVAEFNELWDYYKGKNVKILARKKIDSNSPDNRIPIPYGRKIITTFAGYAYRPKYITYKLAKDQLTEQEAKEEQVAEDVSEQNPTGKTAGGANPVKTAEPVPAQEQTNPEMEAAKKYLDELKKTFSLNNEHIKTSRAGRNAAIFGVAYEMHYIGGQIVTEKTITEKAEPCFFPVDPRELILFYDYSSEPKKAAAIRFCRITNLLYNVEVYWRDIVLLYERKRTETGEWQLIRKGSYQNFYSDIPVVAYYFGDELLGLIRPILPLIDAYDTLLSDSVNEFERFAFAYLLLKMMGLTPVQAAKAAGMEPNKKIIDVLSNIKRRRVFENIPKDGEIKFLTKDIPSQFVEFMSNFIKKQIHVQSHVPDFSDEKFASQGLSGVAIQRMLFDFENIVSSTDADFDVGLYDRIRLITKIYEILRRPIGSFDMITINHKRNLPLNVKEYAETAAVLGGVVSRRTMLESLPEEVVPDVDAELKRQMDDMLSLPSDIEETPEPELDEEGNPITSAGQEGAAEGGNVQQEALNGTQIVAIVDILKAVTKEELTELAAVELLVIAFPLVQRDAIAKMVKESKKAKAPEEPAPFGQGNLEDGEQVKKDAAVEKAKGDKISTKEQKISTKEPKINE